MEFSEFLVGEIQRTKNRVLANKNNNTVFISEKNSFKKLIQLLKRKSQPRIQRIRKIDQLVYESKDQFVWDHVVPFSYAIKKQNGISPSNVIPSVG